MKVIFKKLLFILISNQYFYSYDLIINESILLEVNTTTSTTKPKCSIKKCILFFLLIAIFATTIFIEFFYKD
jgi:hypothetical protein